MPVSQCTVQSVAVVCWTLELDSEVTRRLGGLGRMVALVGGGRGRPGGLGGHAFQWDFEHSWESSGLIRMPLEDLIGHSVTLRRYTKCNAVSPSRLRQTSTPHRRLPSPQFLQTCLSCLPLRVLHRRLYSAQCLVAIVTTATITTTIVTSTTPPSTTILDCNYRD